VSRRYIAANDVIPFKHVKYTKSTECFRKMLLRGYRLEYRFRQRLQRFECKGILSRPEDVIGAHALAENLLHETRQIEQIEQGPSDGCFFNEVYRLVCTDRG
jgi:hypothetical protein